jgi:hypothetical protein
LCFEEEEENLKLAKQEEDKKGKLTLEEEDE